MVDIQVNDVILDDGRLYKVVDVHEQSKTMDLKCYNEPLIYRGVPIANASLDGVQVLKEVPSNVKFLSHKPCT